MSRLSIEIDAEQHRQIKTLATFAGMTMKDFILSRTLAPSSGVDTTEELLSHPENKQRLLESVSASPDEHVVFESLDDLKDALGV
ncbi:hypothetical protein [Persicirhabdus sediminis]|uniref:Uncharacterized protein n=1 Tax=Persicirhabdus sediminis TaxID=454144 RepID=A0A8J7MF08_9BACT|nr:hypothetical protein [Persicirhabdus sediminis]MBK1792759.1 hypothetical protein [Persicirhabdus sediminis]